MKLSTICALCCISNVALAFRLPEYSVQLHKTYDVPDIIASMPGFQNSFLVNTSNDQNIAYKTTVDRFMFGSFQLSALKDPWFSGNTHVQLVTVQTNGMSGNIDGINNIGQDQAWDGFISKIAITSKWLDTQPNDSLVIFVDDDVIFGGCAEKSFLKDFDDIQNRNGGQVIVTAAERGCYELPAPWKCEDMAEVPEWARRNWSLAEGGLTIGCSPIDPHGQTRYLNSGFIVGPVQILAPFYRKVLSSMSDSWKDGERHGDQYYVTKYLFEHPGEVVLDYANSLVTCGYSLEVKHIFELRDNGTIHNRVTQKEQCFFHSNGPGSGKTRLEQMRAWQSGGPKPW